MKVFKILGHPVTVLITFMLLLISGKHIGGFYLMYILLGLPNGAPHAILATLGIVSTVVGINVNLKKYSVIKHLLYIIGDFIMIVALLTFFALSNGYNDESFTQTFPIITFCLFGLCVLINLALFTLSFTSAGGRNDNSLKMA